MALIKLKKLEEYLQDVANFEKPKMKLEQYVTPPHIASCMLHSMQTRFDDIEGKIIGDLGGGCGMLSIGAALLGAGLTIGFDIDEDALRIFRSNVLELEMPSVDCILSDVLGLSNQDRWQNVFDTVITNPPFGTKNNHGIDVCFVERGVQMATNAVYSLHKTTTRNYIKKKAKEWNTSGEVIAQLKYNLDASYMFHKRETIDIEVDFWRFDVSEKNL